MSEAKTLAEILGQLVRQRRRELDLLQDDVARQLRDRGLPWRRSTVASFELGHRLLDLEEVWVLCYVLETSLADLLAKGETNQWVERQNGVASFRLVRQALVGGALFTEAERAALDSVRTTVTEELDETVRRAARTLGVAPSVVMETAQRLWGRSLPEERDARIAENPRSTSESPRTVQALRGWVTRQLLAQLKAEVSR